MLTIYFKSPFTLERLRSGPSGPYLDGFAHKLHLAGYSQGGAQRLLRAAAHLGVWGQANDNPIQSFNKDTLASFQHHLSSCCCPRSNGGRGPNVFFGAKRFLQYLHQVGVVSSISDAILTYLQLRGTRPGVGALFLSTRAPMDRPLSSVAVSSLVARAIKRAGIVAPSKGAHILRHSAATEMLRQGLSLEDIGAVLRHRSVDTTAHYAKVDLNLLREITQPWPEGTSC